MVRVVVVVTMVGGQKSSEWQDDGTTARLQIWLKYVQTMQTLREHAHFRSARAKLSNVRKTKNNETLMPSQEKCKTSPPIHTHHDSSQTGKRTLRDYVCTSVAKIYKATFGRDGKKKQKKIICTHLRSVNGKKGSVHQIRIPAMTWI